MLLRYCSSVYRQRVVLVATWACRFGPHLLPPTMEEVNVIIIKQENNEWRIVKD